MNTLLIALALLAILAIGCDGYATRPSNGRAQNRAVAEEQQSTRRSVLSSLATTIGAAAVGGVLLPDEAFAEAETMERGGVQLTPFNSLAFNYRGERLVCIIAATLYIYIFV